MDRPLRGAVDYWCNAFTPDRRGLWEAAIEGQGIPLKIRRDEKDGLAEPDAMVARMDELGIATLVIPTCDLSERAGGDDFEPLAARPEELRSWMRAFPGRFAGAWSLDPRSGMEGVHTAGQRLAEDWIVALHVHTHSFDRRLDAADYYPYYALATDYGVPVIAQAGASGGRMASECGRPIGIDRPALYFPQTRFVLSHTGWPWVEEAVSMATRFSNVYLGTASWPPAHWPDALLEFVRRAGRTKVLIGTGFPVCGHRHVMDQLDALDLEPEHRRLLLEDNARSILSRL